MEGCDESTTFESQKYGIDSQGDTIHNFKGYSILESDLFSQINQGSRNQVVTRVIVLSSFRNYTIFFSPITKHDPIRTKWDTNFYWREK